MISSSSSVQGQQSQQTNSSDALGKVDMNDFLKLLVTQLQNQDPLNPMDDAQILQQVSQIKAIESNQRLSDTLTSMQLQQGLSTASALLQKNITGITGDGTQVTGTVDRVTMDNDGVNVCIGDKTISLKNISGVNNGN
jgi:flagellar basal-body rod modification protein FlgD